MFNGARHLLGDEPENGFFLLAKSDIAAVALHHHYTERVVASLQWDSEPVQRGGANRFDLFLLHQPLENIGCTEQWLTRSQNIFGKALPQLPW